MSSNNMLTNMAKELLEINCDLPYRINYKKDYSKHDDINNFELYTFNQTWPSTAGGFGGWGGCAMTTTRTYVFVPSLCVSKQNVFVYFGGKFAYEIEYDHEVPLNNFMFWEDLRSEDMASVTEKSRYEKKIKNEG